MAEHYTVAPQVVDTVETRSELTCDTRKLETSISHFRKYAQIPIDVTHNDTCHTHNIATGKKGSDPGELENPCAVAIHEDTHQIFIANDENDRVEVFSETGEYLYQLGVGQLFGPYGIAIHGDSVYVSCWDHTVNKFSLTEMCCVRRIGSYGSNNGQFNYPKQLITDPIGRVFIADSGNNRICIHDPDLNHLGNISLQLKLQPFDVKISRDRMYVLFPDNSPCILTLEGDKLHSFIVCGEGMDVLDPYYFCFDPLNNFVISDYGSDSIRVFSPEGNLLHTIGEGHQQGMFYQPNGVAITPNWRLVCVSDSKNYGLQIL